MSKNTHPGCPMLPRGDYPDSKEYCQRNCKRTRCWGCPKVKEYGLELQDMSEVERNIKEMEEGK